MITFNEPAYYIIVIKDELHISITEKINIEDIKILKNNKGIQTRFRIKVKDQAHLLGIMNILYSMHRVILKIESIDKS